MTSSPLKYNPLFQLTIVKIREFLREPEALFWTFAFPILMAITLAIAFRSQPETSVPIGVVQGTDSEWVFAALDRVSNIEAELFSEEEARRALRTGSVALVVVPGAPWTYWFDPTRPEARFARLTVDGELQSAAGRTGDRPTEIREMTEKGSRYVDFLIPGLLGMNLLGTGVWGIGFYVVNSRMNNLLKRLIAAPMRKSHFLAAQIFGRLLFLAPEAGVLLGFSYWVLDVPIRGSLPALALTTFLGAMTFSGFGLLIGSRAKTIEGVSGLMNLVLVPNWIFGGIFFSTSRFPDLMQPYIQALPLTATVDALRAIMLEGATLVGVAGELAILAVWAVVTFSVALRIFRWT